MILSLGEFPGTGRCVLTETQMRQILMISLFKCSFYTCSSTAFLKEDHLGVTLLAAVENLAFAAIRELVYSCSQCSLFTCSTSGLWGPRQKLLLLHGEEDDCSKGRVQNQVSIKIHHPPTENSFIYFPKLIWHWNWEKTTLWNGED